MSGTAVTTRTGARKPGGRELTGLRAESLKCGEPQHIPSHRGHMPRFWTRAGAAAVAVLLSLLGATSPAQGGLVLNFGQANYTVNPGQGVDVPVYLTETGTDILATDGLNGAGLVVRFNLAPQVDHPAQVSGIALNPGVNDLDDFLFTSVTPATGTQVGSAELMFSIVLSNVLKPPAGSSELLLGTFHFVAGSVAGQTTSLSVEILPGGPQFYSGSGLTLDGMISTSQATITTTAVQSVPEPPGLVLALTGVLGVVAYVGKGRVLGRRWRICP